MAIERYIGGGKIFFSKYNGTTYDAEVEIGEIQSATLKVDTTEADAFSKDTGISKKVDKVVTKVDSSLSFTTQNVSKENMAMAMFGSNTTENFLAGDTLPDGTVATADVSIPVILGAENTIIEGSLKFVGVNTTNGANPVLVIKHAYIKPSGDVRDYFADKHATLAFTGEIAEVNGEYFKEYFMPKA